MTAIIALIFVEAMLGSRTATLVMIFGFLELIEEVLLLDGILAVLVICSVGMIQSTAEGNQLVVIGVAELRQLAHPVPFNVLAVGDAVLFVLVALSLILRLFLFIFVVVTTLVQ